MANNTSSGNVFRLRFIAHSLSFWSKGIRKYQLWTIQKQSFFKQQVLCESHTKESEFFSNSIRSTKAEATMNTLTVSSLPLTDLWCGIDSGNVSTKCLDGIRDFCCCCQSVRNSGIRHDPNKTFLQPKRIDQASAKWCHFSIQTSYLIETQCQVIERQADSRHHLNIAYIKPAYKNRELSKSGWTGCYILG